jgi:hypothetical protein
MKSLIKNATLAGIATVLLAAILPSQAEQNQLVVVGGNASIKLLTTAIPAIFGGTAVTNSTNSLIISYRNAAYPNLASSNSSLRIDFNLTGGAGATTDLALQHQVALSDNSLAAPTLVITAAAPEDVNIDSSIFTSSNSLVVPVVYIKNTNFLQNDLALITNITQRNAVYLTGSGGYLPTGYFSGSSHTTVNFPDGSGAFSTPGDNLFFVGRSSIAAVRQLFDFNIYNTALDGNFTTNAAGYPIPYVDGLGNPSGAGSGSEVVAIVKAITNSIGTVAVQDAAGYSTNSYLSYEGVPFSVAAVANGSYPLWGYERYLTFPTGNAHAPTSQQAAVIGQIYNKVQDPTFQAGSAFTNKFVGLNSLQVKRVEPGPDGTAITSLNY